MPSIFDPVGAYSAALQQQGPQEAEIQKAPIHDFGRRALAAALLGGLGQVAQNLTGNRAYGQAGENFLYKPRIDALMQYRNHLAGLAAAAKLAQAQQKLNEGAESSQGRLLSGQAAYQRAFHPVQNPKTPHIFTLPSGAAEAVDPLTGNVLWTKPGVKEPAAQINAAKLALFNKEQTARNAARAQSAGRVDARQTRAAAMRAEEKKQAAYNRLNALAASGAINPKTGKPLTPADVLATEIQINAQHDQRLHDLGVPTGKPTMPLSTPTGSIDWEALLKKLPPKKKAGTGSGGKGSGGTGSAKTPNGGISAADAAKVDANIKKYLKKPAQ